MPVKIKPTVMDTKLTPEMTAKGHVFIYAAKAHAGNEMIAAIT